MLDPRIYRTSLVLVVFAVFVLAFSLDDQQGPLSTTLAPDAFNAQNAFNSIHRLNAEYPLRAPGSAGDDALASYVAQQLRSNGFVISTRTFRARTAEGSRTLETVTGIRPGEVSGSIVVVAHRDAKPGSSAAELSGTAVLLELARVLAGETQHRSIILASTSGSIGASGADQLARSLSMPVDAVIVLGDLAGARPRYPVVVPWSNGQAVAPTMLRNTLAAAVSAQSGLRPGGTSIAAQLAHLAFPFALSDEGPFAVHGESATLLSISSDRGPAPNEPLDPATLSGLGRAALVSVNALDTGPSVPGPSGYLLFDDKVIPAWAIRFFVLALILPVLAATVDGLARVRRRGHRVMRWTVWVLSGAIPFVLAALVVLGSRMSGLLDRAPPGPVPASAIPLHSGGVVVLVGALFAIACGFGLRRLSSAVLGAEAISRRPPGEPVSPGAGAALLLVMCVAVLAIWVSNPVAAGLMVIALHLWMWIVDPEIALRRSVILAFIVIGLAPVVLVILYFASQLGVGPIGLAWNVTLMLAGGHIGLSTAIEWCIVLGCVASVISVAIRAARVKRPEEAPVTVRGPVSYAGPGSLGGTESALRRAR